MMMTRYSPHKIIIVVLLQFAVVFSVARPISVDAEEDDFADVNSILRVVSVKMPDVPPMSSNGYSIDLSDIVCYGIEIGDASLSSQRVSGATTNPDEDNDDDVQIRFDLSGLHFSCQARYRYQGLLGLVNDGDVYLSSRDSGATATATVGGNNNGDRTGGQQKPPTSVALNSCQPVVEIVNVDFDNGGFIGWVLDVVEGLLRNAMENLAADKICEELQNFVDNDAKIFLRFVAEGILNPYLIDEDEAITLSNDDPVHAEEEKFVDELVSMRQSEEGDGDGSSSLSLLNLKESDTVAGRWINELIRKGVESSNKLIPVRLINEVGTELQVNRWIRDYVFDQEDGSFTLSNNDGNVEFPKDGILYDGEDTIARTTIVLDKVKLLGLDTLTEFSPLTTVGNCTLETNLGWRNLAIEMDATVTAKPSTRPDASVIAAESQAPIEVVERVKFMFGVEGLTAGATLLAAIDQTMFEEETGIQIGSLLKSRGDAIDCLLSSVLDLKFGSMEATAVKVLTPSVEGLVSPGLDRFIGDGMDAANLLYEEVLLKAAPNYFQKELRPTLTQKFLKDYVLRKGGDGNKGGRTCAEPYYTNYKNNNNSGVANLTTQGNKEGKGEENAVEERIIDFRDLLLPPNESIALGGSGTEPYGDMVSGTVVPYLREEILNDTDKFNEKWVRALTKERSGTEGALEFFDVWKYGDENDDDDDRNEGGEETKEGTLLKQTLRDSIDFRISKVSITNIDTVAGPIDVIKPLKDGNVVRNRIGFGNRVGNNTFSEMSKESRYLTVTGRFYLSIDDDDHDGFLSPFHMRNELDLSVSIPSSDLTVDVLADLREQNLLEFPLGDITDPHCWLSSLNRLDVSSLSFSLSTFFLHSDCVTTSKNFTNSPGCDSVSHVLKTVEEAGLATSFRAPIIDLVEDVLLFKWDSFNIERMIKDAPDRCPHNQYNNKTGGNANNRTLVSSTGVPVKDEENKTESSPSPQDPRRQRLLNETDDEDLSSSSPSRSGLSKNSLETLFALGVICLQSSIVVSALNNNLVVASSSPIASNSSSKPFPTGEEILDLTNLTHRFGSWIDMAFDEFREYLSSPENTDVPNTSAFPVAINDNLFNETNESHPIFVTETATVTPRVNDLLREYVFDNESDALEIKLENQNDNGNDNGNKSNPLSFTILGVTVSIDMIRIGGLDTITSIEPFVIKDPHTMTTSLKLDELSVIFVCNMSGISNYTKIGDGSSKGEEQLIELVYGARGVSLNVETRIALNATSIGKIRFGSVFEISNALNCLMDGVEAFEISDLDFAVDEIDRPDIVASSFSLEQKVALTKIVHSLHDTYRDDILSAIPSMTGSTIRDVINNLVPAALKSMSSECPSHPKFPPDGVVDFRKLLLAFDDTTNNFSSTNYDARAVERSITISSPYGNIFQVLYSALDKEVMQTGASNRPVLNDLLKTLTVMQSNVTGTINVVGTALDTKSIFELAGLRADLGIQVSDVIIENLDSIGDPLYLFRPVDNNAQALDNKLSFGVDSKPIRFEGTLVISLDDGAEMKIRNEVKVSFSVEDVTVQAGIILHILENSISSFPFKDLTNLNCWVATILPAHVEENIHKGLEVFGGLQLLDQSYSIGESSMSVECYSCTSPDFDQLLLSLYEPQDITSAIREQTSSLMDSGFVQTFLNDIIQDAKKQCPHNPEYDPNSKLLDENDSILLSDATFGLVRSEQTRNPMYFSIANTIVVGCLIAIGVLGKVMLVRRNKKWMRSLTNEGRFFLDCQLEKQRALEDWLDTNTTSLFASNFIPKSVRWSVPFLLLLNIIMYMVGHLGLLSVVNLDVVFAGQSFSITNFLEFRFIKSTKSTFDNGGAEVAILIWIFMGIWPYVKLLLSLVIWMVPPKYLGVTRRGSALLWIDALARLSVIDIFTLILAFAILLVFIGGPDESIKTDGIYYSLKAIVVPKVGCYCLIVAQRMSRVSSQFLLDYHKNVVTKATKVYKAKEGDTSISQVVKEQQLNGSSSFEIDLPSIHFTDDEGNQDELRQVDSNEDSIRNSSTFDSGSKSLSQIPTNLSAFTTSSLKVYRWGHLGAILGVITIMIVFIIGCVFAPAIAFDVSAIGGISIESDYTYQEAVSEYGVFLVISGILLKARFVLRTKADYIGLGFLLVAAGVSISLMFLMKAYRFIKRKIQQYRERNYDVNEKPSFGHKGCGLPSYFCFYKWKHIEIYFISVCIGVWQLGSIISYTIHLYCSILTGIFDILTSIGIVEPTEAQCNRIQTSLPGNLIITLGSFFILIVTFLLQASAQYKKNLAQALMHVDQKDVPTLSLAWSQDKSKNSRYSHLTDFLSLSVVNTEILSSRTRRTPSQDIIEEVFDEEEISIPVASPLSDISSERSSTIDAPCELATTDNLLSRSAQNNPLRLYHNFKNTINPWRRSEFHDHSSDESAIHSSLPPIMTSPSEDTASTDAPSPPRTPNSRSSSKSPPPRFRSTSGYIHHIANDNDII